MKSSAKEKLRPAQSLPGQPGVESVCAGEPEEVAPCHVFPASADASDVTGPMLSPRGGAITHG